MAVFHLQCVVHRGCVSGIVLDRDQFTARTEVDAVNTAEVRFSRLLGPRSGLAILKDDAGRVVWTGRHPKASDTSAEN